MFVMGVLLQKCTKPQRVQKANVRTLDGKGKVHLSYGYTLLMLLFRGASNRGAKGNVGGGQPQLEGKEAQFPLNFLNNAMWNSTVDVLKVCRKAKC